MEITVLLVGVAVLSAVVLGIAGVVVVTLLMLARQRRREHPPTPNPLKLRDRA